MARSSSIGDAPVAAGPAFTEPFCTYSAADLAHYFLAAKPLPDWPPPAATHEHIARADAVLAGRFSYIGETYDLPPGALWSVNLSTDKEWLIAHHKHYFAVDLCQAWRASGEQRYLDAWVALTTSWLEQMGSGFITASDAQVEAKRVESWITAYLALRHAERQPQIPAALIGRLVERLGSEATYIASHLKPSRNHRTFQLFAMFLVGTVFPELRVSAALRDRAHGLLVENLLRDFTLDGVHVERSTHYHNITLETALGFAELARLTGHAIPPALETRLRHASQFSMYTLLPDGEIPLIGDSDTLDHSRLFEAGYRLFGDPGLKWAATRGEEAAPPAAPSRAFDGYYILTDGQVGGQKGFASRQHIFYDCAALGEGSHSHYDLFSLCWTANGRQIVVDPGRYTYQAEPDRDGIDWRHAFKRTRSHNTIEIDGRDQTRYLSKATRPAAGLERYEASQHKAKHGPAPEIRDASHYLGGSSDWVMATAVSNEYRPRHTRALVFMLRQYVVLLDHVAVDDGESHACTSRLHLDAVWRDRIAVEHRDGALWARAEGWTIAMSSRECGAVGAGETGWVSKTYGVKQPAPVLALSVTSARNVDLCTVLMPDSAAGRCLRLLGVTWLQKPGQASSAVAVDISVDGKIHRDLYMLAPNGSRLALAGVDYRGKLVACRLSDDRPQNVCGLGPAVCAVGPIDLPANGPGIEWSRD